MIYPNPRFRGFYLSTASSPPSSKRKILFATTFPCSALLSQAESLIFVLISHQQVNTLVTVSCLSVSLFPVSFEYTKNGSLVANIPNSRGDFDGKVCPPIPFRELTLRMKNVCLSVMAKLKSENPEFNLDFESFVKELSSDEPVCSLFPFILVNTIDADE